MCAMYIQAHVHMYVCVCCSKVEGEAEGTAREDVQQSGPKHVPWLVSGVP